MFGDKKVCYVQHVDKQNNSPIEGSIFDNLIFLFVKGSTKTIGEGLNYLGFNQFGMEIPLGYGVGITIYPPYKAENWCHNEVEKFACNKFLKMGGAIAMEISWMKMVIAHGLMYMNRELGNVLIFEPDVAGLDKLMEDGVDTGLPATKQFMLIAKEQEQTLTQCYGKRNYKELVKLQEYMNNKMNEDFGINFISVLWPLMPEYFNKWYYSGLMRRGA